MLLVLTLAWPAATRAAPVIAADMVDVAATLGGADTGAYSGANFANRLESGRHWGDEIAAGAQRFDTISMAVERDNSAGRLTITLRTMFDGSGESAYADLYFDIFTPAFDSFGYAIPLGRQLLGPAVYSVISSNTANELWYQSGATYGAYAQLAPASPGFVPGAAAYQYVRLNAGVMLPGYDVATALSNAGGGFYDVSVVVTSAYGLGLFDAFDLFWATADNGADSIWAGFTTVPAPPAGVLAGFGLLLLAGLRLRRV